MLRSSLVRLAVAGSLWGCGNPGGNLGLSPQTFAFSTEGGATGGPIRMYRVQDSGLEPGIQQTPDDEFYGDLAVHPGRPLLLAARGTPALTAFRVDPGSGSLSRVAETLVEGKLESDDQVLIHPAGRLLCLFQNQEIRLFTLTSDRGDVAQLQVIAPAGAGDLNHGVFDREGRFLYAVDRAGGKVYGYRVEVASLAPLSNDPLVQLPGATLRSAYLEPENRYLYLLDDNYDRICCYARNADGTLAENGSLSIGSAPAPCTALTGRGRQLFLSEASQNTTRIIRLGQAGEMSLQSSYPGGGHRLKVVGELPLLLAGDTTLGSLRLQKVTSEEELSPSEGQPIARAPLDLECLTLTRNR